MSVKTNPEDFPYVVKVNLYQHFTPTTRFDFRGVERCHYMIVTWATERFGPATIDGPDSATWTHSFIGEFRFVRWDQALEFKMRWG